MDGHIDLIIRYATAGAASETPFQIPEGGVGGGYDGPPTQQALKSLGGYTAFGATKLFVLAERSLVTRKFLYGQ